MGLIRRRRSLSAAGAAILAVPRTARPLKRSLLLFTLMTGSLSIGAQTRPNDPVPATTPRLELAPSEKIVHSRNLRLTISSCDLSDRKGPEISPKTSNMNNGWEGVRSVSRRPDGVLQVIATVVDECGKEPIAGSYIVHGNSLKLLYTRHGPIFEETNGRKVEVRAACNCMYKMKYEIPNIPRGNIRASIDGTGMSGPYADPRQSSKNTRADDEVAASLHMAETLEKQGKYVGAIAEYRRAARKGSGKAAKRLGQIYSRGVPDAGVSVDKLEAAQWFARARELGERIP
jgi:hypothetical protein